MKIFRLVLIVALCAVTTACGFRLRGAIELPPEFNSVVVQSARPHAPLQRALVNRLDVYGLTSVQQTIENSSDDHITIYLKPEQVERRLLSVYPSGQVAEYELIYRVDYTVSFPSSEPVAVYFEVVRDYQDDPDQVLAKTRELDLVLSEMRNEASDRIIRRLATQTGVKQVSN